MPPAKKTSGTPEPSPAAAVRNPPVKRRQVKLADDADQVLNKCRELRDTLRRKSSSLPAGASSDEDDAVWKMENNNDGDGEKGGAKTGGTKTKRIRLSELKRASTSTVTELDGKKSTIVEVAEMNSTQVVEGIENVAVKIARQVLAKQVSRFYRSERCQKPFFKPDIFDTVEIRFTSFVVIQIVAFIIRGFNSRYQAELHQTRYMSPSWTGLFWGIKLERGAFLMSRYDFCEHEQALLYILLFSSFL